MNNFNPLGYLNNLANQFVQKNQSQKNSQIGQSTSAQNLNNQSSKDLGATSYLLGQTKNTEAKKPVVITQMEVEQSAKYIKELLNLPKEMSEVLARIINSKTMTTAQNVQLLSLLSSGKVNIEDLAKLLGENSKVATQKLVQMIAQVSKMGAKDTAQLQELMNILGSVATTSSEPQAALKNFILLYLPWLPLNEKGENRDFTLDIEEGSGGEGAPDSITILIQTVNFSNIKVILEEHQGGQVEIFMNCIQEFPQEKALAIIKSESQKLNIKTGLAVEVAKKENLENKIQKAKAEISASPKVSPQLVLMAHAVIKVVFKIDKDFSK